MSYTLGFIGAGNMARAIVKAAIDGKVLSPDAIIVADPTPGSRAAFTAMGVTVTESNAQVLAQCEQVLLAIKPQMLDRIVTDLADRPRNDQIIISIMAGITTDKLAQAIGHHASIVRVMPNTPMMIGLGMAGVCLGQHASKGSDDLAMKLFSSGNSRAIRVEESAIDAITAVSGSGPAYVFYLAEAMQRAADELGLGKHAALLVQQTLLGAATLLSQSDDTPAELRRKVTSPGGTTQAAIQHMDSQHVSDAIVSAIKAAEARSRELGQ